MQAASFKLQAVSKYKAERGKVKAKSKCQLQLPNHYLSQVTFFNSINFINPVNFVLYTPNHLLPSQLVNLLTRQLVNWSTRQLAFM
jgi:hypothetical protein